MASRYERVRSPSAFTHAVVCGASTSSIQRYGSATGVPKNVSVTVPRGAGGYASWAAAASRGDAASSSAASEKERRRMRASFSVLNRRRLHPVRKGFQERAVDRADAPAV